MQELELNYPTTKGKVYSEEEDRYLLCRLSHYGMRTDDVYERIKKDISEFPVFRFDWFFKSRSPQELQRRCNTLLGMIEKEAEQEEIRAKSGGSSSRGKVRCVENVKWAKRADGFVGQKRVIEEVQKADKADKVSRSSTPASASANAGGPAKRPSKKKKT